MAIKFRLKGLAETFIENIKCPGCGHDGGDDGEKEFFTDLTRVTYDGIVAVIRCGLCNLIFVPEQQKLGIINSGKLRQAVEDDSLATGQPIYASRQAVILEVERMNATKDGEHSN
jgi:hypothetical protein